MYYIQKRGGPRRYIKYGTVPQLKDAIVTEIESLTRSNGLIALDGTPTEDDGLFASRQRAMEHVFGCLDAYIKSSSEVVSMGKLFSDNEKALKKHKIAKDALYISFLHELGGYDALYNTLKEKVKKYKEDLSKCDNLGAYGMVLQESDIVETIDMLYDILIRAKAISSQIIQESNIIVALNIFLKFIEVGTDIYNDPELFKREDENIINLMSTEISTRHKPLKKLAHNLNPATMEP